MPQSRSMQKIPAGLLMPRPYLSTKLVAVHPAPGREDGNKRHNYEYNNNNIDWAAGPTMWGWESRCTGKKRDRCCRSDPPLLLPPLPTLTFLGGRRCLPKMQSTRNTGSLRILRGWLQSVGEAGNHKQRRRWDNLDCHRHCNCTRQCCPGGTRRGSCCKVVGGSASL